MYLGFRYYHVMQAKLMNFLDRVGVSEHQTDKIVGTVGTTNLWLMCTAYAGFRVVLDFTIAFGSTLYGLYYEVPAIGGRVTTELAQNGHPNPYVMYDVIIILVDAAFAIALTHRVTRDQKRPDALGLGRSMTWDKSRARY